MTLYKGRIGADQGGLMDEINRSLPVDIRLLPYDMLTNKAWAKELAKIGILSNEELEKIEKALDEIAREEKAGAFDILADDEDVHTLVERLLTEKTGAAGEKIHTGRSRNDQVVCDLRLFLKDFLMDIGREISSLVFLLTTLGQKQKDVLLAGATHLQPAQPISLGFFFLSLASALTRDLERVADCYKRTDQCPLGSGALAGSGFPVDRHRLAENLGFRGVCENALDAVSDRDFVQEAAWVCALLCAHLSRYAEQFIIWANPAFGYVRFADEWSTGSSMMPQKRNPDAMELIRGKGARTMGRGASLTALTTGLPLAYAKDLQEDKEGLFDSIDTTLLCLKVFFASLESAEFFPDKMKAGLSGDLLATDLADELVKAGAPFRSAHHRVATFVTFLEKDSRNLLDAKAEELDEFFPEIIKKDFSFSFEASVSKRAVFGGAAPDKVEAAAKLITEKALKTSSFLKKL